MDLLSGEGITAVLNNAGTENGAIIAEKIFCTLFYIQKLEVRELVRTRGGGKASYPLVQKWARQLVAGTP